MTWTGLQSQSIWREGKIKVLRVERWEREKILYRVEDIFGILFSNMKSAMLRIANQTCFDLIYL